MAEAVTSFVVETLGNLLIEEGKFLLGVKDQADQLHAELKQMQWFLKDADQRQNEADRVGEWVSRVRDLAYEAENLIEHYAFKIQSRKGRGVASNIKRCACLLDETVALHQVGPDIESLRTKISGFTTDFHNYGIRPIMENEGGSSSRQQQLRRTYSHVVEEDLVGVESQVEILAKELIDENYKVVSICGMGGLGKTALARKVYHHPDVRRNFDAFSWICISQQWQTRDLLQGILIKFMPEESESIEKWRDEEFVRKLFEFQQNHKCLVVLDDIWSVDAWECIKRAFSIGESGSKVLLTTRNREVAAHIDPSGFLHQPRFLSEKESWELFQRKFPVQRYTQGCDETLQRMEELGKEMIKHCGGLPLAVLVLRGILATNKTLMDWENVHKNIKSYLRKENKIGQDHGGLQSILALSYNDLPYRLKPCFLYLSMYEEDADIDTESLYQIWMAEGMISMDDQIGEETMMGVAERYLEELSERCMVFVEMNEGPSVKVNRFKSCRLHDLMRDLCLRKAKEENFLKLIDGRHVNGTDQLVDSSFFNRYPRLAIHLLPEDVERYVPPGKELTQQLRSFSLSVVGKQWKAEGSRTMKSLFAGYKMLRVLSIIGLWFKGHEGVSVPGAIGNLIHLRYFSLRSSSFAIVPSCIIKLNHLQTLDLRSGITYPRISNDAVWKLGRLKHLYLPVNAVVGKVRLDGLHNLEILENFHSSNSDVKVLSTLTNLRSLKATVEDKLEDLEEFIKQVNHLRYLRCLSLTTLDCDFDSEKRFTLLREMFSWSRLNSLRIFSGRLSKLPEYEPCFLPNVHSLSLAWTRMEEDPMRTLGKLPNLRQLYLSVDAFIGNEMICHANGFLQLKLLELQSLANLNNLWIEEGAMPNLSLLRIYSCLELKAIPEGLQFISTLKVVEIISMPKEFRDRLQVKDGREGEDFDKVRHVPSIIFFK